MRSLRSLAATSGSFHGLRGRRLAAKERKERKNGMARGSARCGTIGHVMGKAAGSSRRPPTPRLRRDERTVSACLSSSAPDGSRGRLAGHVKFLFDAQLPPALARWSKAQAPCPARTIIPRLRSATPETRSMTSETRSRTSETRFQASETRSRTSETRFQASETRFRTRETRFASHREAPPGLRSAGNQHPVGATDPASILTTNEAIAAASQPK